MTDDRKLNHAAIAIKAIEDTEHYGAVMFWYENGIPHFCMNGDKAKLFNVMEDLVSIRVRVKKEL